MNKENKIEQILKSLDGNQPVSAPDFFYTRLKARMEREFQPGKRVKTLILRPVYALTILILVLTINAIVILKGEGNTEINTTDTETAQSLAAEYSLNDNNVIYDLTQE
jgi:hypothetical protein